MDHLVSPTSTTHLLSTPIKTVAAMNIHNLWKTWGSGSVLRSLRAIHRLLWDLKSRLCVSLKQSWWIRLPRWLTYSMTRLKDTTTTLNSNFCEPLLAQRPQLDSRRIIEKWRRVIATIKCSVKNMLTSLSHSKARCHITMRIIMRIITKRMIKISTQRSTWTIKAANSPLL